jgi:hypothetical protein
MTTITKPIQAFDEAELANLLLRMCPKSWQDQYNLTQDSLSQSGRKLLGILENVEKVVAHSNAKENAAKENSEKATRKCEKGKRKGSGSKDYHIPKKENMGAHTRSIIPVSAIGTRKMEPLRMVSTRK